MTDSSPLSGENGITQTQPGDASTTAPSPSTPPAASPSEVALTNGVVSLDANTFVSGQARFFTVQVPASSSLPGKAVSFFVVKDGAGVYHAAADTCQVCYQGKLGFRQEGSSMVCNNCGQSYPLEKIATEKGGCNPIPINPDIQVVDGKVNITRQELEQVSQFF
ncbi:MAG: DUF2318 domain-containing protein [Actinobacteria bacterium]|nr:DUF2318 domain-containing protein [Actinomycetota bacterium]